MTLRMTMSYRSRKILTVLIIVDLLLLSTAIIFFDIKVLYSTQIGYITATFVMAASIVSYRRMVNARVKHNIVTMDDSKDTIDKLEDPYDLYSKDVENEGDEKSLAQTVKEEKKKLKENRRTVYQTIKDTKAALSIYRLSAYALLIIGFLYLNRQQLLDIPSYIISLGIPSVIFVWVLIKEKEQENHSQD